MMRTVESLAAALPLILLLFLPGTLQALSSDDDQPMEILADTAEFDDKNNVTHYRGNVEVTQGTLYMSGDEMTVYHDEEQKLDYAILEGDLAYYRQLPDDSPVHDEAWARRMEYYAKDNQILLIEDARVVQEDVEYSGDHIEYDTAASRVVAQSKPETPGESEAERDEDGRVRVVIQPKKDSESEPASGADE